MRKIGISCGAVIGMYGVEKGFELIKKSGFDAVDFDLLRYRLNAGVYAASEDEFCSHFYEIRRKAEEFELEISQTHGRTEIYRMNDEQYNKNAVEVSKLDLKATAMLGAPSCVIHFPNTSLIGIQPAEFIHEITSGIFNQMIPAANEYKVNIAYETFGAARMRGRRNVQFFAYPDEFMKQFNALDTKYKTICVDTGHTHEAEAFWVPSPERIIKIFGKNVSVLHLHDNDGISDDHLLPGLGNINWPAVFDALDEVEYKGVFNFELLLSFGNLLDEFISFAGPYLRAFVNNRGNLKD